MTCHSEEDQEPGSTSVQSQKFVLSVDVGTTNLRCHVYDKTAAVRGSSVVQLDILYPKQGWVELEATTLWESVVQVMKEGIRAANILPEQVSCIGLTTQRGSFVTWDKQTDQPFHNCILWNDTRSEVLCKEWNASYRIRGHLKRLNESTVFQTLRLFSRILYGITGLKRFLAGSVLKYITPMTVLKLVWALENFPEIRQKSLEGNALFGTLDTFLLWKLTGGRVHATEPSSACITGLYDPFVMIWANWAIKLFNIPPSMLPAVRNTCGEFGKTDQALFGVSIPITAMLGDQQASTFGECCFQLGDVKLTLGTGTFIHINTGSKPHASMKGLYPVVGWKIEDEVTYFAEAKSHDTGNIIDWARSLKLFDDPSETSAMANSVPDSGGVYFVPAFTGIQAPINDNQATCSFLGITAKTTRQHMVRAILEALAFRVLQMFQLMEQEADFQLNYLRIDGGVASNDFLAQLIADLTGRSVDRPNQKEMTCLGAAFMAGLATGVWKDKNELMELRKSYQVFQPTTTSKDYYNRAVQEWERAVSRCLQWYPPTDSCL